MSIQRRGVLSQDQRVTRDLIFSLMREHGIRAKDIGSAKKLLPEGQRKLTALQKVRVSQILQLMQYWRIEPKEIGRIVYGATSASEQIKYRHPKHRELFWNGNGDHPPWLRQALLQDGYRVDELKPENQSHAH